MVMDQGKISLIGTAIGVIGALGGVFLGQFFGRRSHREQWILETRKEEARELLDALSSSFEEEIRSFSVLVLDGQDELRLIEATGHVMRIIRTRIFTADIVENTHIEVRWAAAIHRFHQDRDLETLASTFGELRSLIVKGTLLGFKKIGNSRIKS